jgi:hypothetical protein
MMHRIVGRHVAVGIHQVHLATGRITREGEPITVEPVTKHKLWTPPDPLLNRIVGLVVALLDGSRISCSGPRACEHSYEE